MLQTTFVNSLLEIPAQDWDALWPGDYPFIRHAFLTALETSGSTTAETGWQPAHLVVKNGNAVVAAMPVYKKNHSYGEYVFDWGWADACHRAGIEYYPKLVCGIPFTPATGPRIGFASHTKSGERKELWEIMQNALKQKMADIGASGFHCLFPQSHERQVLTQAHYVQRQGCQFHWFNRGYKTFDDFLASFNSRKRKNLKRERQKVFDQNIVFQMRTASALSESDWRLFYLLYQRTYFKRSGHQGYLSENFFQALTNALPEQVLLCSAHENTVTNPMHAAALYFRDSTTLYGRYWGAREDMDGLHFETCYYQGIEYAIKENLHRFDPGAQGEHKIQRGFTPVKTCSYHWLQIPELHNAVKQFVTEEQKHNHTYCEEARAYLPFKEGVATVFSDVLLDGKKVTSDECLASDVKPE